MWKKKCLALVAVILILVGGVFISSRAMAATTAEVTVTAVGFIVGAPGNFTLIYVNDTTVGISWTKSPDADYTMVRVRLGEVPSDRDDGYLVYSGNDTYFEDASVNLLGSIPPYYRAWSRNATTLVWEEMGSSAGAFFMTQGFMMFGLIAIALGSTFFAFRTTSVLFRVGCAGLWLTVFIFFLEVQDGFVVGWESNWFKALALSLICLIVGVLLLYAHRVMKDGVLQSKEKDIRSRGTRATDDYKQQLRDMGKKYKR